MNVILLSQSSEPHSGGRHFAKSVQCHSDELHSAMSLSAECHYGDCHSHDCHFPQCHSSDCCGASHQTVECFFLTFIRTPNHYDNFVHQ